MAEYPPNRTRRRWPARFVFAVTAVLLFSGVGGAVWVTRSRQIEAEPSARSATPPDGVKEMGVGALGRLEPGWKIYQVGPASSADGARVETLSVEEGDEVKAGAVLAVLDTNLRRKAAVEEAKAQVLIARARLAQVKAGAKPDEVAAQAAAVAKLKAALGHAEAAFRRVEALRRSGSVSSEEFDQKKADVDGNRALLRQSEATLAALKSVRPEDVAVAEAEVVKAEAGVSRTEADLDATRVRSPLAGRVLKIYARAGERVGESGLADVGDTAQMHAVAEVYERDAPRVKAGQRAMVRVQSLPGELGGEVVHVGWKIGRQVVFDNDPVKDTDARVVEVRIRLDSAGSARVAGLSYARVEVRIDTRTDTPTTYAKRGGG
jgi:HlyD family secretion protein